MCCLILLSTYVLEFSLEFSLLCLFIHLLQDKSLDGKRRCPVCHQLRTANDKTPDPPCTGPFKQDLVSLCRRAIDSGGLRKGAGENAGGMAKSKGSEAKEKATVTFYPES